MERFVIEGERAGEDPAQDGVTWLLREVGRPIEEGAIVVPGVASIRNLGGLIGQEETATAERERRVFIDGAWVAIFPSRGVPDPGEVGEEVLARPASPNR